MSEMIKRVARAIAENQHYSWLYDPVTVASCDPVKIDIVNRDLEAAARAAIEAMKLRDTERPIIELAAVRLSTTTLSIVATWDRMIDETLK